MLIYPDSSNLINLTRGTACIDVSDLAQRLDEQSHRIVLSLETLVELTAPLRNGRDLEVRRHLNQLERLPLIFVNEGRIYDMELREAVGAFEQKREYDSAAIRPFASRLDGAIDIRGVPLYIVEPGIGRVPTNMILNFRLAEQIRYLWQHDREIFDVQRRREADWLRIMESDRAIANPPSLSDHFVTMMIRALTTHQIPSPAAGAEPFASWVYESPERCPGIRLAYETQHRFRRNLTARPRSSDLMDLARVTAVPYVDFFVTDAAMMTYCRQAAAKMNRRYPQLFGNFGDVLSHLGIIDKPTAVPREPLEK